MNNEEDTIEHFKKALDLTKASKFYVKCCDVCVKLSKCYIK